MKGDQIFGDDRQTDLKPETRQDRYELLFRFELLYRLKQVNHILTPGQVLPVWNINTMDLAAESGSYEVRTLSGIRKGDYYITEPHAPCPDRNLLESLMLVDELGENDPDEMAKLALYQSVSMGGVGGERIIRPDRKFLAGVPVRNRRDYWGNKQIEVDPVSMFEFYRTTRGMTERRDIPQLPRFFYEDKQGLEEAVDVVRERTVQLSELIEVPFAWESAETFGYWSDTYVLELRSAIRKMTERGVCGKIYIGFDVGERTGAERQAPRLTEDDYNAGYGWDNPLWVLPHVKHDPFGVLNQGAKRKLQRLLSGTPYRDLGPRARLARVEGAINLEDMEEFRHETDGC